MQCFYKTGWQARYRQQSRYTFFPISEREFYSVFVEDNKMWQVRLALRSDLGVAVHL